MISKISRPIALVILDGWGVSARSDGNAIAMARTPYYDEICSRYPATDLVASGPRVGLADGAAGSAEIGHMNIGAGRLIKTDAVRIDDAIRDGQFFENEALVSAIADAVGRGVKLHLIGMLSDAGIHASPETLYALLRLAKRHGAGDVLVHGILDGRDVPVRTADIYVEALEIKMADIGVGRIASVCGRFYAMDVGENWERTARAFTLLALGEGERAVDARSAIRSSFLRGISDEFIAPIVIDDGSGKPAALIESGDVVIFFNHRGDSMRQLARSLAVPDPGPAAAALKPKIRAVCMTEYDRSFGLEVAFPAVGGGASVAKVLRENGVSNFRVSDAERFAHVTTFFNCGAEQDNAHERRAMLPPTDTASRETEPEMSSFVITDRLLRLIETSGNAVFVVNLPAADLLAETGNYERTVEAVQYVDTCLGAIVEKVRSCGGAALVTSSHGNCEQMLEQTTMLPNRLPTRSNVPFHLVDERSVGSELRRGGSLHDIAPTLLAVAGLATPGEMSGRDLRIKQ